MLTRNLLGGNLWSLLYGDVSVMEFLTVGGQEMGEIWARNQNDNQRTNGPVNAHLISWLSKAQNIQNLENIW